MEDIHVAHAAAYELPDPDVPKRVNATMGAQQSERDAVTAG